MAREHLDEAIRKHGETLDEFLASVSDVLSPSPAMPATDDIAKTEMPGSELCKTFRMQARRINLMTENIKDALGRNEL